MSHWNRASADTEAPPLHLDQAENEFTDASGFAHLPLPQEAHFTRQDEVP